MSEVALGGFGSEASAGSRWRKSTHSNPSGNCVELAPVEDGGWQVRDSQQPAGPRLTYRATVFTAFVASTKHGRFDITDC